ncbi:MAG: alpha-amylase family glycosyl hydrolase [Terrimicrobiaceae bacterium]|nr:alpha-amylase family glycosyl hydrolase [Terrimicrobiaceae bacterium]
MNRPLIPLFLVIAIAWLTPARATNPADAKPFLGWIPIQYVAPGSQLVLDMRRFANPGAHGNLKLPRPEGPGFQASYDPTTFELRVRVDGKASGFLEIPLRLEAKPSRNAVLTIAVQGPGALPTDPTVFAESRTDSEITFRATAPTSSVSAVVQYPEGTSEVAQATVDGDRIRVATESLPPATWVRVAVLGSDGRISRPARAATGPDPKFRWQDGVIYYAFTDRFVNGNRSNDRPVADQAVLQQANYLGGDFDGIRERIKSGYFSDLGINVLWLAPLNRNPDGAWQEYLPPYRSYTGYHGYWPVSHTEVEPRFGGADGLKNLVSAAHENNIRLIADLVLRHVHIEHPLWKEKREWFGELMLPDGRKNLRIWDEQQFTTWFEEWLPGFDFDKPEPVAFLLDNAGYWVNTFGLDGYRLDAVKHIKPSFWWKFRTTMRSVEDEPMYFVGETFMDRQGIMQFVGPNMLDGQFDFPLYDTIIDVLAKNGDGFDALDASLGDSETIYGKETLMSPLVGNHDKSRFMAFADGDLPDPATDDEEEIGWAKPPKVDDPASYRRLMLALSFILSIDGVPMIYYGDEVGLTGAGDPDNRRMMPDETALSDAQKAVREHFRTMARARHAHPSLRYGHRRTLAVDEERYAFVRRHLDDVTLAAWNKGTATQSFDLGVAPEMTDGNYRDSVSGKDAQVANGRLQFSLGAGESALWVKR